MMNERCSKRSFPTWTGAIASATLEEKIYGGKRKVYFCTTCEKYHTATERVNTDAPLPDR